MSKHTELPWSRIGACIYMGSPGSCDATTGEPKWGGFTLSECPDPEANAQLIVTAVNNHAKLVEALRESLKIMEMHEEALDGEFGPGRDFKQIVADGDEPEAMKRYRTLLAQLDGK